ncbi:anti-sigma factor family protein [Streptomyces sp. NPDC002990]
MSPTTGTTGTIRHPDVSEISDLAEGLLSPARSAEVLRHLGACSLCADVRASLDEIRGLLGTLPGPPRMPAEIAGRIDAALAAEALLDSTTPRAVVADRDVSRETSHAPAGPAGNRPSGHPSDPSRPGRRRARRRIAVLAGLAGAAACALGIFLFNGFSGTPPRDTAVRTDAPSSATQHSGQDTTYTAQGLGASVQQLLDSGQGAETDPGKQNNTYGTENIPTAPGLAPDDRRATAVPGCVQSATGRPDVPLATERGTYQGTDVYLLVLPHSGDSTRVDAYLIAAGCGNGASATPEKPLLTSTFPRS